jgi:hypothetical protein
VEAAPHRDDVAAVAGPVLLGPLTGELDRGLVGLGARVGEEHAIGERVVAEQLGELRLLRDIEEVRHVEQRRRLLAHRPHHPRMGVPERGDRDAPGEVEVLLAVAVPDPHPVSPDQRHRIALGGGHHVPVRPLDHLLGVGHVSRPFLLLP